jgi:anthranilate phosphoribosyltransferase
MITAFVLIVAKSGVEKEVVNALADMPEIREAKVVYGQYDIIAKVELEDIAALNGFLLDRVRAINGVESSSTLVSAY